MNLQPTLKIITNFGLIQQHVKNKIKIKENLRLGSKCSLIASKIQLQKGAACKKIYG